ncbi:hypothetical protein GS445_03015 [Rhodococcus hoagii]|nr:hypothetical protein [Prescottella equi]
MSTAEQIIAEHRDAGYLDGRRHCLCGWSTIDHDGIDPAAEHAAHVVAALTNAGKTIVDSAVLAESEQKWRRRERIHHAIYLWSLVEDSESTASTDYERGADMAYQAAATFILSDCGRRGLTDFDFLDDAGLCARLVEASRPHTRLTKVEDTGEIERVLAAARVAEGGDQ